MPGSRTPSSATPPPSWHEGENFTDPTRDTGTVYAGPIPFPTDKTTFGIKAIATAGDKLPSTVSYIRYNSTTNIGRPDPPELRLNGWPSTRP